MLLNSNLNCTYISQEESNQDLNSLAFNQDYFSFISQLLDPSHPLRPCRLTLPKIEKISKESPNPRQAQHQSLIPVLQSMQTGQNPEFKLNLESTIETPLYKGKYFSFKVSLKELRNFKFPSNEKLELEAELLTLDNEIITNNMRGNQIIRGNFIQYMSYYKPEENHVAYFKIQITEVSSHYIGKKVNLRVKARFSEFLHATGWKITPITIPNLTIKSKKSLCTSN